MPVGQREAERQKQGQEQARIDVENTRAAELARDAQNEEDERREREAGIRPEKGEIPTDVVMRRISIDVMFFLTR